MNQMGCRFWGAAMSNWDDELLVKNHGRAIEEVRCGGDTLCKVGQDGIAAMHLSAKMCWDDNGEYEEVFVVVVDEKGECFVNVPFGAEVVWKAAAVHI